MILYGSNHPVQSLIRQSTWLISSFLQGRSLAVRFCPNMNKMFNKPARLAIYQADVLEAKYRLQVYSEIKRRKSRMLRGMRVQFGYQTPHKMRKYIRNISIMNYLFVHQINKIRDKLSLATKALPAMKTTSQLYHSVFFFVKREKKEKKEKKNDNNAHI